ncbi:conjugative transposon protein TraO [Sphingobacterium siyangense]|uniref:Conjugative transposon protein TraO n=2 Tax=Sphingobacterium siyangense TaxID=459529 RepID=A0A562MK87_9SPHI|nr:conjugative transposon protein TraO [Sphingobacterium siyangense]
MALFVFALSGVQAQRMVPKQKGLEINVGVLSDDKLGNDYFLNLALNVYGKNGNYWLFAAEYNHEYATYGTLDIPLETYLGEAGYSLQLLGDARKIINLNVTLTGVLGYETFNRNEKLLYDGSMIKNENGFVYGTGGRLSLETYLSDHFVLILQGRAKVLWGTSRDEFRPSAGLGLRFNF